MCARVRVLFAGACMHARAPGSDLEGEGGEHLRVRACVCGYAYVRCLHARARERVRTGVACVHLGGVRARARVFVCVSGFHTAQISSHPR